MVRLAWLGLGFSNLAHLYSPEAIVMGGGVSQAFDAPEAGSRLALSIGTDDGGPAMTISLGVKSSFQFSPALTAHIERRIHHALHAHGAHIASVALRLSDVNGPRHGANDKLTRIDIRLRPSGSVMASARSDDIYVSVTRAATRARAALSKRIRQLKERARDSDRFAGQPDRQFDGAAVKITE